MLTPAPVGVNVKWDKGSWLASDGAHTLYAHKAKYQEFYSYNTETDSWNPTALVGMPIPGSGGNKKSKDGGCGTYSGGNIYAMKGGNTQEYWNCTFTVDGNAWAEKETMPKGVLKKKVKAGAGIVAASGYVYAIKGNKTNELWMHSATLAGGSQPTAYSFGVMSEQLAAGIEQLRVVPNPLASGFATLRYSLPGAGMATVRVCDVTGRIVLTGTVTGRKGSTALDLRRLNAGVYLVKVTSADCTVTQKLVVQR
jgi:hypothetical protein